MKYSTRNQHQIVKQIGINPYLNIILFISTRRYESTYTGTWNLNSIYHIYQEGSQMSQSYIRTRGQGGGRVLLCGCLETPLSWSHAVLFRHPTSRSSHWIESKQWSEYSLVDLGFLSCMDTAVCIYICRGRPCTYTIMCICPWPNCYGIAGERTNQFLTTEI